eukprot:gene17890-biopygen28476
MGGWASSGPPPPEGGAFDNDLVCTPLREPRRSDLRCCVKRKCVSTFHGVHKSQTDGTVAVGVIVLVARDFMSDDPVQVLLKQGMKGKVEDIDEDGDAVIAFGALGKMQWVSKDNCSNLVAEHGVMTSPPPGPCR